MYDVYLNSFSARSESFAAYYGSMWVAYFNTSSWHHTVERSCFESRSFFSACLSKHVTFYSKDCRTVMGLPRTSPSQPCAHKFCNKLPLHSSLDTYSNMAWAIWDSCLKATAYLNAKKNCTRNTRVSVWDFFGVLLSHICDTRWCYSSSMHEENTIAIIRITISIINHKQASDRIYLSHGSCTKLHKSASNGWGIVAATAVRCKWREVTGTIVPQCTGNIIWDLIINNSYFIRTGNVAARCSRCTRKFPTSFKKAMKELYRDAGHGNHRNSNWILF